VTFSQNDLKNIRLKRLTPLMEIVKSGRLRGYPNRKREVEGSMFRQIAAPQPSKQSTELA
jgi:hypothetical protein